jgi:hypothetical protein
VRTRPVPGVELAEPELRLVPEERRLAEVGWDRQTMSRVVRALGDGLYVGDYFDGEERLDMILRAAAWETPEELAALPIATPDGTTRSLSEFIDIHRTAGPDQIRRVDRRRTITLVVTPPTDMALGTAIDIIREQVDPVIRDHLPEDGDISYRGTADDKDRAIANMARSLALAVVILYLLMSAMFRSFRDSLLVIVALPMAIVGGVISLRITGLLTFQPMDLLTMIGFITLMGLVVNNAILLVAQTRSAEREGMARTAAVEQAVRFRLRPILMSTLTSLFGMLPLLLIPGSGTELYRGLAAVIVGGLAVSTLFTLVLLPSLLRIGEDAPSLRQRAPEGCGLAMPAPSNRLEPGSNTRSACIHESLPVKLLLCLLSLLPAVVAAQGGPPPAAVRVAEAQMTSLSPSILVPGTVVSINDARMAAEVAGRLTWIAEIGASVAPARSSRGSTTRSCPAARRVSRSAGLAGKPARLPGAGGPAPAATGG